jgi:ABC-type transporter Mla subunit MlaD
MLHLDTDRTSQLESFAFRIERTVENLATKMTDTFSKLFSSINQFVETQALLANSLASLHKRLDTFEQTQQDYKSELGAMNRKLDQVLELLQRKGV